MSILRPSLGLVILLSLCASCPRQVNLQSTEPPQEISPPLLVKSEYLRSEDGKIKNARVLPMLFTEAALDTLEFPSANESLLKGLNNQLKLLKYRKEANIQRKEESPVSIEQLEQTVLVLIDEFKKGENHFKDKITAFQSWGKEQDGAVHFTGYYTPVLGIQKFKNETYKYPLYKYPKNWEGHLPTRRQIDGEGVLKDMGLEIGYSDNLVDIYYMQLQGSGFVNYLDTEENALLRYAGKNGHAYRSIEIFMQKNKALGSDSWSINGVKKFLRENPHRGEMILFYNPSYVFFQASGSKVKGAGGVELIESISVAADPLYFPLGSVLLSTFPILNKKGQITHHESKLLLVQDVGGNIKGPGHLDVYSGIGKQGQKNASIRNHYGEVLLLLPNEMNSLVSN